MYSLSIIALLMAISFTAIAQILYKLYFVRKRVVFLLVSILFFLVTPLMSYIALRELSLGTVYVSTGLTYVLVLMLARLMLDEVMSQKHLFAVCLIVSGVIVFNY